MWGRGATSRLFHFDCPSDDPMIQLPGRRSLKRPLIKLSYYNIIIKKHFLKIKILDISNWINLDLICFWRIKFEKKNYVQIYAFFSLFSKCRTLEKM